MCEIKIMNPDRKPSPIMALKIIRGLLRSTMYPENRARPNAGMASASPINPK